MTEFRYFGRFNPRLNAPVPGHPGSEQIDENEARRRFLDPNAILEFVPPADPATGHVPYIVEVTTGAQPSFVATRYTADALPDQELWWKNLGDGRLFLGRIVLRHFDFQPWTSIVPRTSGDWDSQVVLTINDDDSGDLRIHERGTPGFQTADTTLDSSLAYRPVPEWGHWDELLEDPGLTGEAVPT